MNILYIVIAYLVCINLITFFVFYADKERAILDRYRVPEFNLLTLSFIGGLIGSFFAIYALKHKNRKVSFLLKFYVIVFIELIIAIELYRIFFKGIVMVKNKIDLLIKELVIKTGLDNSTIEYILTNAIAKAYNGCYAALINEDGIITITFLNEDDTFYLKDFVVSRKKFNDILSELNKHINQFVLKNDDEKFIEILKNSDLVANKLTFDGNDFILEIDYEKLSLKKSSYFDLLAKECTFFIKQNDLYFNDLENLSKGIFPKGIFTVDVFSFNSKNKTVYCKRVSQKNSKKMFFYAFNDLNKILETNYSIKKIKSRFISDTKEVIYFIEFRNKGSNFFISELSKRLKKLLGKSKLNIKF